MMIGASKRILRISQSTCLFATLLVDYITMTKYLYMYLLQPFIYSLVQVSWLVRTCSEWHTTSYFWNDFLKQTKQFDIPLLPNFLVSSLAGSHSKSFTLKRLVAFQKGLIWTLIHWKNHRGIAENGTCATLPQEKGQSLSIELVMQLAADIY